MAALEALSFPEISSTTPPVIARLERISVIHISPSAIELVAFRMSLYLTLQFGATVSITAALLAALGERVLS